MSSWASFSAQVKTARREPQEKRDEAEGSSRRSTGRGKGKEDITSRQHRLGASKGSAAASSFLDLKAELADRQVAGSARTGKQGAQDAGHAFAAIAGKREKRLPAHLRPSPHVLERSQRHDGVRARGDDKSERYGATSSWASTPSSQLEEAARQAALERKAKLYDQLQHGKTGGLDDERLRDSLIDWDRKEAEQASDSDSESEDGGDRNMLSKNRNENDSDDPMTEYEDDLGRTRKVRRSEVPRAARRAQQRADEVDAVDEDMITYGPSTAFPVYRRDPAQRAQGGEASSSSGYKRSAPEHFAAAQFEKRYRGAGFYQFSQDAEERAQQMQDLRLARDATLQQRHEQAASQGSAAQASNDSESSGTAAHDALATDLGERRREARRQIVEEKKRALLQRQRALFGFEDHDG